VVTRFQFSKEGVLDMRLLTPAAPKP
jgi:hypothetical protein